MNKLPDYRLKQKILYMDKTSPESLISYGDMYLEAGGLSDALVFYAKAAHRPGIEKIKDLAMENGDTFIFQGAVKALDREIKPEDWENIARRAVNLGKYLFARHALAKTSNTEFSSALETRIKAEETKQNA